MNEDILEGASLGAEASSAERSLLGSLLVKPTLGTEVWAQIQPEHFWRNDHRAVADILRDLHRAGKHADMATALGEISRRGQFAITKNGTLLADLYESAWAPDNWKAYALEILGSHRRRELHAAGLRACQAASNLQRDVDSAAMTLMEDAEQLTIDRPGRQTKPPATLDEFLAQDSSYDWLIEGLLERGDRLMLTGAEGLGKSELCRQIAVALAAGVHPFQGRPIKPVNVLYVDCENGPRHMRRRLEPLRRIALKSHRNPAEHMRVLSQPAGIDLANPTDVAWLLEQASLAAPDILILGPLYRLYTGAVKDEEVARQVTVALDQARTRLNCSVIVEAHAPHSEHNGARVLRPAGSSLWLRWPEFGLGIRPVVEGSVDYVELAPWRGNRDERDWPESLKRGQPGQWPWLETVLEMKNGRLTDKEAS